MTTVSSYLDLDMTSEYSRPTLAANTLANMEHGELETRLSYILMVAQTLIPIHLLMPLNILLITIAHWAGMIQWPAFFLEPHCKANNLILDHRNQSWSSMKAVTMLQCCDGG